MATNTDITTFLNNAIAQLSNLTRLEVNTLVGTYEFNQTGTVNTTIKNDSTDQRMCSQINLLTGDISTAMTDKFVSEYKELREYHMIRENQGHEIVKRNIEVLIGIFNALDFFDKKNI
jgi:Asp-tRNA(Asn)/Glu-tRNA(Gln) amidotransferase B subunit